MRRCLNLSLALASALAFLLAPTPAHAGLLHYLDRLIFPIQVTTEYDHDTQLGRPTYSWGAVRMDPAQYNSTVQTAVNEQLAKKGWQLVASGGQVTIFALGNMAGVPALKAYYHAHDAGDWAGNWGEHGWGPGWKPYYGEQVSTAVSVPGNNLVLDMFDTTTKKPIFRSVAEEQLWDGGKKNISYLDDSVKKMLKKLPK